MSEPPVSLRAVERVDVTLVVDNFVDLLITGEENVSRYSIAALDERQALIAEHGFSALVTVHEGGRRASMLYDAGLSRGALAHNLDVLQIDVLGLRALVLSHGHSDHHGGLEGLFARHGRQRLPLLVHPDAWRERRLALPTGGEVRLPPPSRADLEAEGVEIVERRRSSLLIDDTILVSGEVERTTGFERGLPIHEARTDGGWTPDPLIVDDQNLIVDVRGEGLVIVSGCSHAGAVNVVRNAQRLTGRREVAGFVGGCHLTGGLFEAIIEPTVREFAEAQVGRVLPAHCTGWRAVHALARAMPDAFVQPSVGTTVSFGPSG